MRYCGVCLANFSEVVITSDTCDILVDQVPEAWEKEEAEKWIAVGFPFRLCIAYFSLTFKNY